MLRLPRSRLFLCALCLLAGCKGKLPAETVVLYTSVDEPYARPLIEEFQAQTGIQVTLVTDAESSKSVGLVERLRSEKDNTQADVWWDNETFLTVGLGDEGLLQPYDSPSAADIPARFKDPNHLWAASILRVRMLISHPKNDPAWVAPSRLADLLRPDLAGQIAIARPTAGSTGGHVAALYVLWGTPKAEVFFHALHDQKVALVGGNSVVGDSVARGEMQAGLCDNDDATDAADNVGPVHAVLPDQGPGADGTLALPCSVAMMKGAPHPDAAHKLIDFLLSHEVDQKLLAVKFAWCSARDADTHGKLMNVDISAVARAMRPSVEDATLILEGRK